MLLWTLRYTQFFWIGIFISLDIYPRVWLLDHMLTLFLIFLKSLHTGLHQFTFRPTMQTFLYPQQYMLLVVFLVIVIVTDVRLYLLVVLICISLIISGDEHLFMHFLVICLFFRKVSILVYCLFFIWVLAFFILICILDINPLSDASLANIFFHSVSYILCICLLKHGKKKQ